MSANQSTVLPWHLKAAHEARRQIHDPITPSDVDARMEVAFAAIIARHDPHQEALRLLKEALIGIDLAAKYETTAFLGFVLIGDKIRAHLAAHSKPDEMKGSQ